MSSSDSTILFNKLIRAALDETIEICLETSTYECNIKPASKKGDNFMGIVYRVTCHKTSAEIADESGADLKLIVKVAPESKQRREAFSSRLCFLREIYLFNEVSNQGDSMTI